VDWFAERGRVYVVSREPCGTFLAGSEGRKAIDAYGCPVFSLGEPYYSETMLPKGYKTVVDWFQNVASDLHYANPVLTRYDVGDSDGDEEYDAPGLDFNKVEETK